VSSREFVEWIAFDRYEPIGTRTTPDLLALLIAATVNPWRKKGARALLPQDVFPDPLAPRRLTPPEEARRTAQIGADYRRLRKERLAKMAEQAKHEVE
jgi:hypothetical protein